MADKRRKSNAAKKRKATILAGILHRLVDKLNELAEGLTPPERIKAHVAFYESCNETEQDMLKIIFKAEEDKDYTEITEFFAEKYNG